MSWQVKLCYLIAFVTIASGLVLNNILLIGAGAIINPILGLLLD